MSYSLFYHSTTFFGFVSSPRLTRGHDDHPKGRNTTEPLYYQGLIQFLIVFLFVLMIMPEAYTYLFTPWLSRTIARGNPLWQGRSEEHNGMQKQRGLEN